MKLIALLVLVASSWWPRVPAPLGFVGDSITHSVRLPERTPEMAGALLGAAVVDRGVGGTDTAAWLPGGRLLPPAIAAFRAAGVGVVQVALGTNDALFGVPPARYRARIAAIVRALRASGFRVVVARPPYLVAWSMGGYVTARSARLLASYGTGPAWAYFRARPLLLQDGVHPGPEGSAALAAIWAAGLR